MGPSSASCFLTPTPPSGSNCCCFFILGPLRVASSPVFSLCFRGGCGHPRQARASAAVSRLEQSSARLDRTRMLVSRPSAPLSVGTFLSVGNFAHWYVGHQNGELFVESSAVRSFVGTRSRFKFAPPLFFASATFFGCQRRLESDLNRPVAVAIRCLGGGDGGHWRGHYGHAGREPGED